MATVRVLTEARPLLLLPLLLLLLLTPAAESRSSRIEEWRLETELPAGAGCATGKRAELQEALDALFTCLYERRVKGSRAHRLALGVDFGGVAGSGAQQKPLLSRTFSVRDLLADDAGGSYRRFFDVVSAFTPQLGKNEIRGPKETASIEAYLRHLEGSDFIVDTFATLRANGALPSSVSSVSAFVRRTLWAQWFELYARSKRQHAAGLRESSGFGHVLVGEVRASSGVTGFHSWLQILAAEERGEFAYQGHFKVSRGPVISATIQFKWLGQSKPISSFIFGVQPEFELALFTASFVANPGRKTEFTLAGSSLKVQTYNVGHQPGSIATAYVAL